MAEYSPSKDDPSPIDTAGHRARLRDRLLNTGGAALADHELVEYLLTLAIHRNLFVQRLGIFRMKRNE